VSDLYVTVMVDTPGGDALHAHPLASGRFEGRMTTLLHPRSTFRDRCFLRKVLARIKSSEAQ
jgi:hypothetical protein